MGRKREGEKEGVRWRKREREKERGSEVEKEREGGRGMCARHNVHVYTALE